MPQGKFRILAAVVTLVGLVALVLAVGAAQAGPGV
jgi:hypothetical protein